MGIQHRRKIRRRALAGIETQMSTRFMKMEDTLNSKTYKGTHICRKQTMQDLQWTSTTCGGIKHVKCNLNSPEISLANVGLTNTQQYTWFKRNLSPMSEMVTEKTK